MQKSFEDYDRMIKFENKSREAQKHESFKESNLNIQIQKFKGYDSSIDI